MMGDGYLFSTFMDYRQHIATYYGGPYLSEKSKVPQTDMIEKAKGLLGTSEESKWYYLKNDKTYIV